MSGRESLFDVLRRARDLLAAGEEVAEPDWFDQAEEVVAELDIAIPTLEGLDSVRRCNDPMPTGDGMQLCDRWPGHDGPHYNAEGLQWRQR